jgi:hypothetical protein
VRVPELLIIRCRVREFGGPRRPFIPDERLMTKDILEAITQLTADFGDALVGCAAVLARVTAVLHQRDRGVSGPDNVISRGVDWAHETVGHRYERWLTNLGNVVRWTVRHAGTYDRASIGPERRSSGIDSDGCNLRVVCQPALYKQWAVRRRCV